MAATVNVYKVHYHFERSGIKCSEDYYDYVQAAKNDYNTLSAVITRKDTNATLVIDSANNTHAATGAGAIA